MVLLCVLIINSALGSAVEFLRFHASFDEYKY